MKTLYIDTHLNDLNILLFDNDQIIREEHVINQKNNSTLLMPSIIKVIDNESFDEILVVNGPGSFTGVRLGVTVAKTLAYTKQLKIKTINYLDIMHASSGGNICAFSDGNGYYLKDYSNDYLAYLNNNEYAKYVENKDVVTEVTVDYKKVFDFAKTLNYTNPHAVNPIYIKKIGVEKNDTKS